MASSYAVGLLSGIPDGLVSIGIGLWGVVLARWVFINRENRRLPRKQPWHETLPLTLVAMLVAAVLIHDREMGLSSAAFTGLGVGWSVILLLDIFGERIQATLRAGWAAQQLPPTIEEYGDQSGHGGKITDDLVEPDERMAAQLLELDKVPGSGEIDTPPKS